MQLTLIHFISSALLIISSKADVFLLPCPIKYLFHFDCPGCGFQRSVLALLQGNLRDSFQLYPPTIAFLFSFLAAGLTYYFKWDKNSKLLRGLYFVTAILVVINYAYKLITYQL